MTGSGGIAAIGTREELGAALKRLLRQVEHRTGRDISKTTLARKIQVSQQSLYAYLAGTTLPPRDVLDRLLLELGVTGADLARIADLRDNLEERSRNRRRTDTSVGAATAAPAAACPRELPMDIPGFTGRTAELAELDDLLHTRDDSSAVVISAVLGTAGVGKTALAIHWAHRVRDRFPDGQLYLDLRGYDNLQPLRPADALATLLRSLGSRDDDVPRRLDDRIARYRSLMDGRRTLLLLDNASSADQVRPLLPGTASCFVLVTSRDALGGLVVRHGARRVDLDVLSPTEATNLLRSVLDRPRVDSDPTATAALTQQCARLPLALRIAAEYLVAHPRLSLADLVVELNRHHLDLFDAGGDERTAVRSVFSWSYQHLPTPAARVFRLLGLQPARESGVHEIAALAGIELSDARRHVDVLLRTHLLAEPGHGRYTMHDLLRAYAAERLAVEEEPHDRRAATGRLLDHFRDSAAIAARCGYPASQHLYVVRDPPPSVRRFDGADEAIDWLDAQSSNLVAAAAYAAQNGWALHASDLSDIMARHLMVNGPFDEAVTLHRHAADATSETDPTRHARALLNAGQAWCGFNDNTEAERCLQQALVCFRTVNNRIGEGSTLASLGQVRFWTCHYQDAIDLSRQAITLLEDSDDWSGRFTALNMLAAGLLKTGHAADAAEHWERAYETARTRGDRERAAKFQHNLGIAYQHLGRYNDALRCGLSSLESMRRTGARRGEGLSLHHLGVVYRLTGRLAEAEQHIRKGLQISNDIGNAHLKAESLNGLGDICHDAGRFDEAITHYTAALPVASACGNRDHYARAHDGLGRTYLAIGKTGTAHDHWQQAITAYEEIGVPEAEQVRISLAELDAADDPHVSS